MAKFTNDDYEKLLIVLATLDVNLPSIQPYADRVVWEISEALGRHDEHKNFESFRASTIKMRATEKPRAKAPQYLLAILTLPFTDYLREASYAFPSISYHIERLLYEVLKAIATHNHSIKRESFEEFRERNKLHRQVQSFGVKGVG